MVDVSGDGSADDVALAYLDGAWRLRLEPSTGPISEVEIADVGPGYVDALGAVQIDEAPGDQIMAVVGSGASGVQLGLFGVDDHGCLFRFTHGDGTPIDIGVGATTGAQRGVFCAGNTLFAYGADAIGDGTWQAWGVDLRRTGASTLDFGTLDSQPGYATDDLPAYELDCAGLTW